MHFTAGPRDKRITRKPLVRDSTLCERRGHAELLLHATAMKGGIAGTLLITVNETDAILQGVLVVSLQKLNQFERGVEGRRPICLFLDFLFLHVLQIPSRPEQKKFTSK